MKKALAILTILAVVAGAAFADTYGNEAAVSVTGNATLTWGIQLDEPNENGFKNAAEWEVKIPLLAKQTFTHKGEGDAYAEISIKDAEAIVKSKHDAKDFALKEKVDSVAAKLVFGNISMTINGAPSFKPNNADVWTLIRNDDYFADNHEGKDTFRFEPGDSGAAGTAVTYTADKFSVTGKVVSRETYEKGGSRKSEYGVGADFSVTPVDMLTVSASGNYSMWDRSTKAADDDEYASGIMSYGLKVVAKPADATITLAVDGGNDYVVLDKDSKLVDSMRNEVLFSAAYKFIEAGVYYVTPGLNKDQTTGADTTPYWSGLDKDGVASADAAAYLKLTDGDFVENLDGWFTLMTYHLLSDKDAMETKLGITDIGAPLILIGTGASYKYAMNDVNYVKPFFELFAANNDNHAKGTEYGYAGSLGADYGLFTNAVVTAKYEAGSTNKDLYKDMIDVPAKSTKGLFTLACKVTY